MAVYIVGREGIWPLHNRMRAPILIESEGYPEGYPRADYRRLDVLHDGGDWFIVFLQGDTEFEQVYLDIEPLSDTTFEGLLKKIYVQAEQKDDSKRTQIAKSIKNHLGGHVSDKEIVDDFDVNIEEKIKTEAMNNKFLFTRPTKEEIELKNLRP